MFVLDARREVRFRLCCIQCPCRLSSGNPSLQFYEEKVDVSAKRNGWQKFSDTVYACCVDRLLRRFVRILHLDGFPMRHTEISLRG